MIHHPLAFGPFLQQHVFFETRNLEEAEEITNRAWIPHQMAFAHPREKFYRHVGHVPLTDIAVCFLNERGRLNILAGPSDSVFLISLRAEGASTWDLAGKSISLSPDCGVIQSPGDIATTTTGDCQQVLGLTVDEAAVQREMERQLGFPLGARIKFDPAIPLHSGFGTSFRAAAIRLCHGLDETNSSLAKKHLWSRQMEKSLISLLVEGHRHNYTRLAHRTPLASPWQVRTVEEFIREHASQELSLGDLAAVAGVSARTLQFSFRRHRAYSPMQFLRRTRLERARRELQNPQELRDVTGIALKWGFLHLGRFAAEYRKNFSEAPSNTLRRGLHR